MGKNILYSLLFFLVILAGCNDNSTNNIFTTNNSPIWPQPGFNARNTSNPKSPYVYMNPVLQGVGDWSYLFPSGNFSDGGEFCVDSKGNIYYLNQLYPAGALYKFRYDGTLVWKIDSLMQNNYCGISLSADEKKIYLSAYKIQPYAEGLYCVDSGGTVNWFIPGCIGGAKPVIGRDGTIYTFKGGFLTAISSYNNIVWTSPNITQVYTNTKISLDEADNLYLTQNTGIVKASKTNGDIIWQFTSSSLTEGIVIDGFGNVYFNGYSNRTFYCLNKNGQLKWSKPNANQFSSPVISKDNIIFVSTDNNIAAYDTAGNEIWKKPAFTDGGWAEGVMLDDEDNIYYIRDMSGITAGSISKTGLFRWQTQIFNIGLTLPPPVLIPQGKLLFAPKRAGKIQAIK
jgi:hypothetical protein